MLLNVAVEAQDLQVLPCLIVFVAVPVVNSQKAGS
jgi:hypothetical protein